MWIQSLASIPAPLEQVNNITSHVDSMYLSTVRRIVLVLRGIDVYTVNLQSVKARQT